MNYNALRQRYLQDAVSTASPATLLVMLYDRLVLDLLRAEGALREKDRQAANTQLQHAQDIISELANTLDMDVWDGARQLMSIYNFLLTTLVDANINGDADLVVSCRELIEPLQDAWQRAASQVAESEPERSLGELGVA
jgi:flagellar protein FliS